MGKATATKIERTPPKIYSIETYDHPCEVTADYFEISSHEDHTTTVDFFMENPHGKDELVASFKNWKFVIPIIMKQEN